MNDQATSSQREPMAEQNPARILLVDDEVNITRALRRLLNSCTDYEIHTATSGAEGLELLQTLPAFALIISDQRMPQMTGVEFFKEACRLHPETIRILLTGYTDINASIAAINQGAVYRYLSKPWQDDELLAAVDEAVRHYQLTQENKRLNALVAHQKEELHQWNQRLKQRVMEQTSQIRAKSDALAEKNQRLRSSFDETIAVMAGLIEMRDRKVPGHSRNVAELVGAMAETLRLDKDEAHRCRAAALLHDIGKIAFSDDLLKKNPQNLEREQRLEYCRHVIRGQAAIDPVPELRELGLMIRHHHEKFDGTGFPDGLQGKDIPLGARLIAVADFFERKLHDFPEAAAYDEALAAMDAEWGTRLDPKLKRAFKGAAAKVFSIMDFSANFVERKLSPSALEAGMQLLHNLYTGTGVLLLKKGTIFTAENIEAIHRIYTLDPFERDINVLIEKDKSRGSQT
jgi:response regulator RpfG family c-di-GMP phosphodiesterase